MAQVRSCRSSDMFAARELSVLCSSPPSGAHPSSIHTTSANFPQGSSDAATASPRWDWYSIRVQCAVIWSTNLPVLPVILAATYLDAGSWTMRSSTLAFVLITTLIAWVLSAWLLRIWVVQPLERRMLEMVAFEADVRQSRSGIDVLNPTCIEANKQRLTSYSATEFLHLAHIHTCIVRGVAREAVRQMMRVNFHMWRNSLHGHLMALGEIRMRLPQLHQVLQKHGLSSLCVHVDDLSGLASVAESTANDIRKSLKRVLSMADLQDGKMRLICRAFSFERIVDQLIDVFAVTCAEKHINMVRSVGPGRDSHHPNNEVLSSLDQVVQKSLGISEWSDYPSLGATLRTAKTAPRLECRLLGDSWMLMQCMMQILSNAIRHSQSGSTVRINHRFVQFEPYTGVSSQTSTASSTAACVIGSVRLEVEVVDEGSGLSPAKLDAARRVLSGQDHVRDVSILHANRAGLGMHICRGIIQKHGGTIKCESPATIGGQGTRVSWAITCDVELVCVRKQKKAEDVPTCTSPSILRSSTSNTSTSQGSNSGCTCRCSRHASSSSSSSAMPPSPMTCLSSRVSRSMLGASFTATERTSLRHPKPVANLLLGDGVMGVDIGQHSPGVRDLTSAPEPLLSCPSPMRAHSSDSGSAKSVSSCQEINLLHATPVVATRDAEVTNRSSSDEHAPMALSFAIDIATDQVQTPKPTRRNALVVDDDALCRKMLAMTLRRLHFNVSEASDGDECLVRVASTGPDYFDVIFMDGSMERMHGVEATRELTRSGCLRAPIIAITGNSSAEDLAAFLAAGALQVHTKPLAPVKLQHIVEKLLQPV